MSDSSFSGSRVCAGNLCSSKLVKLKYDRHSLCTACRGQECSQENTCMLVITVVLFVIVFQASLLVFLTFEQRQLSRSPSEARRQSGAGEKVRNSCPRAVSSSKAPKSLSPSVERRKLDSSSKRRKASKSRKSECRKASKSHRLASSRSVSPSTRRSSRHRRCHRIVSPESSSRRSTSKRHSLRVSSSDESSSSSSSVSSSSSSSDPPPPRHRKWDHASRPLKRQSSDNSCPRDPKLCKKRTASPTPGYSAWGSDQEDAFQTLPPKSPKSFKMPSPLQKDLPQVPVPLPPPPAQEVSAPLASSSPSQESSLLEEKLEKVVQSALYSWGPRSCSSSTPGRSWHGTDSFW
ncbi:serine/arginine repetitive matrix protein 1-like [Macrobrachium rosenbergii]|uniref:serine/arginine repetitive matrix protein 1-like n=1 Tax=Macrobrachium rosenbergii TaxID=79674 RepID=UPI0034D518FE